MLYSFAHVIFFFFFFPPLLSGPYLWNRYSQRLQIECAAWSCCLILQYSLPSNSLRYYYYFFLFFFSDKILSGPYLWNRYSQRLQIECAAWSCGLILQGCCMGLSMFIFFHFFSFFFFFLFSFFFFFPPRFCPGHISGTVTRRNSKLSVLLGPAVYLCTVAYHRISLGIFFFFFFSHQDFVRAISLEPLLAVTPNWVCCLVLRSSCALLLTIQFASLFFIYFFFSAKILSGPYLWNRYLQRLQIQCAAWSCGLIVHCCLPSNLLRYFFLFFSFSFFRHNFVRAISGTVTRRDSKLSVLLGPAV